MTLRWLYHVATAPPPEQAAYAPATLSDEGFIHASFRDDVAESGRLYFPRGAALHVYRVDPRLLDVPVRVVDTPRGPMPHIHGAIPRHAITRVVRVEDVPSQPDAVD